MSHLVTLLKKKKVMVLYIHAGTCDPQANSLSWLRCCQTPLGRGFETCVDVRAKLGDALCNLVVLPTPWHGYWWSALFLQWSLPSTSGKRQTDPIHHRLGTPYRWVSGKKIHPVVSLDYTSIFGKQYDGIGTRILFFIFYFLFFIFYFLFFIFFYI